MDNERHDQGSERKRTPHSAAGFRAESADHPLVYGYVRSRLREPNHLMVYRRALESYCWQERLRLCLVFADHGVRDDIAVRPGLTGLCDVLSLPDSFAAVLISLTHLSRDDRRAVELMTRVRDTGARVLFLRPTTRHTCGHTDSRSAQLAEWWQ